MKVTTNIATVTAISSIVFIILATFVNGSGQNDVTNTIFTASTFLFGIFIAFAINNSINRFNKITELLVADEANLLYIYKLSSVFGEEKQTDIRNLIDKYLVMQIDYYLTDYKLSSPAFFSLFDYITQKIKVASGNNSHESAQSCLISTLLSSTNNRKQTELLLRQPMLKSEWISILTLLGIIIFSIFCINDRSFISIITSALLSAASLTLVLILRNLDSLRWKENLWIWEDLHDLFRELDLTPYYPKKVITSGRVKIHGKQTLRLATYPNPYPNFQDKVVKLYQIH